MRRYWLIEACGGRFKNLELLELLQEFVVMISKPTISLLALSIRLFVSESASGFRGCRIPGGVTNIYLQILFSHEHFFKKK
jgi:hypothetical protein